MAVQTEIEKTIPALYKRNVLNTSMFSFVRGVRATLHTVSVREAIQMFMINFGLDEDDYNSNSAEPTYYRMQTELRELNQTQSTTDG